MALPWVRLDTAMPDHPKILGLLAARILARMDELAGERAPQS